MADTTVVSTASPVAAVYTVVHTANEDQVCNLRLVNRDTANGITVRVAICRSTYAAPAAPAEDEYIEPKDVVIEPGGIVEDMGLAMVAGGQVVVRTSAATLSARVDGMKAPLTVVVTRADVPAGVYTTIHTVGAGKSQSVNIRMVNRDPATSLATRLAVCPAGYVDGTAPNAAYFIEPVELVIEGGGLVEELGKALKAGEKVVAYTNIASLTTRVTGFEE